MPVNLAHATYSPSGSHRWMNCPGSIAMENAVPKRPATIYALEGTAAHTLAEECLLRELNPADKIGSVISFMADDYVPFETKVTPEMAGAVQVYIDTVQLIESLMPWAKVLVEKRLDLSWIANDFFGTGDHVLIDPADDIYVTDFKYGAGVAVDVIKNTQLMIYGLGAVGEKNEYANKNVVLTIVQPRAVHPDGHVRDWRIRVKDLQTWSHDVLIPAIMATKDPEAPLVSGTWCRWCNAVDECPELRREIERRADVMFGDDLVPVDPSRSLTNPLIITGEQLDRLLMFSQVLQEWMKRIKEEAERRIREGTSDRPTQFKLVTGKTSRSWLDEAQIIEFCKDYKGVNCYSDITVKSPAQLETEFKLNHYDPSDLGDLIDRKPGNPQLVSIEDPRPALPPAAEMMFDRMDEEDIFS